MSRASSDPRHEAIRPERKTIRWPADSHFPDASSLQSAHSTLSPPTASETLHDPRNAFFVFISSIPPPAPPGSPSTRTLCSIEAEIAPTARIQTPFSNLISSRKKPLITVLGPIGPQDAKGAPAEGAPAHFSLDDPGNRSRRHGSPLRPVHLLIVLLIFSLSGAGNGIAGSIRNKKETLDTLNTLLETLPIPMFYKDTQGRYLGCNRAFETFIGRSKEEIVGKTVFEVAPPELAEKYRAMDLELLQESGTQAYETQLQDARGDFHQVIFHKAGLLDAQGSVIGIIGAVFDITQRKEAEENLKASHHRLHQIIEFLPDATFVIDKEGRVVAWNRAIEELTGVKAEDILGKGNYEYAIPFYRRRRPVMIDLVISDDHSLDHMYAYVTRDEGHYESESFIPHLRPGGAYLYNTARALYDADGSLMGAIESIRDITEQKRSQAALEESRRQLAEIIDALPDPCFVIDAGGRVAAWNRAMEDLTGIGAESMIGKGDYEYSLPFYGERRPILIDLALSRHEDYQDKYISITRREDGVLASESFHPNLKGGIYLAGTARVLRNARGQAQWAIESLRDITSVKQAEIATEAARKAAEEADRAKGDFLANMSHEIRTPLNGVIGMTTLLLDSNLSDRQRRCAEIVRNSGESLLHIINDILDFSKIEAGKLELEKIDFDLYSLMDDFGATFSVRAHEKNLELICGIDPDVPALLQGDPGRLRQILTNLTGNAIKFTEKGEVALQVSVERDRGESVVLGFMVQDTGIGIPKDRMVSIFEKFTQADAGTTRRYEGTGLGLSIVKQLVEHMGGRIWVESEEDRGSIFRFTLPFSRQPEETGFTLFPSADIRELRVLVVDDNATNREILTRRLAAWGMRPSGAMDGPTGLEALSRAHEEGDPFHIVLVDMQMSGMDGADFCRAAKARDHLREIPLVLLASLGVRGEARKVRELGFAAYLTKPASHSDLFEVLSQLLGGKDFAAESLITRHTVRELRRLKKAVGARILVVEDNATNREVVLGILEKLGLSVDAAENGLEALEHVKSAPYDLVLMDVQMPLMDGLTATRKIRESDFDQKDLPIIAMTAHAFSADREKCLEAGMTDYISKPVSPRGLAEVLSRWLPGAPDVAAPDPGPTPSDTSRTLDSSPGPAIFDSTTFMERVLDDETLGRRVIHTFLDDMPRRMEALKESIEKKDAEETARRAHTIKGAASNVCAETAVSPAARIEQAAEAEDWPSVESLVVRLEAAHKTVREALEAFLRELEDQPKGKDS